MGWGWGYIGLEDRFLLECGFLKLGLRCGIWGGKVGLPGVVAVDS
jgi:hypothetical protein